MTKIFQVATLAFSLSACASMTERQRHVLEVGGAFLLVGAIAIAAHKDSNDGKPIPDPSVPCTPQPDGSCR